MGSDRGSSSSCSALPVAAGHFLAIPCSPVRPSLCLPCSSGPCPPGFYEASPCTATADRQCSRCSSMLGVGLGSAPEVSALLDPAAASSVGVGATCPPGEVILSACNATHDRICGSWQQLHALQAERQQLQQLGVDTRGGIALLPSTSAPLSDGNLNAGFPGSSSSSSSSASAGRGGSSLAGGQLPSPLPLAPARPPPELDALDKQAFAQGKRARGLSGGRGSRGIPFHQALQLQELFHSLNGPSLWRAEVRAAWQQLFRDSSRSCELPVGGPAAGVTGGGGQPIPGLRCDSRGNVMSLRLSGVGALGSLPPTFGERLPFLRELDLSLNSISGTVPQGIAKLRSLSLLDLSANQLQGLLPQALQRLPSLRSVSFSCNPSLYLSQRQRLLGLAFSQNVTAAAALAADSSNYRAPSSAGVPGLEQVSPLQAVSVREPTLQAAAEAAEWNERVLLGLRKRGAAVDDASDSCSGGGANGLTSPPLQSDGPRQRGPVRSSDGGEASQGRAQG